MSKNSKNKSPSGSKKSSATAGTSSGRRNKVSSLGHNQEETISPTPAVGDASYNSAPNNSPLTEGPAVSGGVPSQVGAPDISLSRKRTTVLVTAEEISNRLAQATATQQSLPRKPRKVPNPLIQRIKRKQTVKQFLAPFRKQKKLEAAKNPKTAEWHYLQGLSDENSGSDASFISKEDSASSNEEDPPQHERKRDHRSTASPDNTVTEDMLRQVLKRCCADTSAFLWEHRHKTLQYLADQRPFLEPVPDEDLTVSVAEWSYNSLQAIPAGRSNASGWPSVIPGVGFINTPSPGNMTIALYIDSRDSLPQIANRSRETSRVFHRRRGRFSVFPPVERTRTEKWSWFDGRPTLSDAAVADGIRYEENSPPSSSLRHEAVDPTFFPVDELRTYVDSTWPPAKVENLFNPGLPAFTNFSNRGAKQ